MNTRFKVLASFYILQYLCDFIYVLIFVTVSKCRKSPKLTNIVITDKNVHDFVSVADIHRCFHLHDHLLPDEATSQHSCRCRALRECTLLCSDHVHVHGVRWAGIDDRPAAGAHQAARHELHACLGLLASCDVVEHPGVVGRSWHLRGHDLLCHRVRTGG